MSLPHRTASYAAVLRAPHARRIFCAALVGRLSYGVVSLSLLLSLAAVTGSYTAAGTVTTAFATASVVLSPIRATLIDRLGAHRVLPAMALLYGAALTALAAATWRPGVPLWLLFVLATAGGSLTPPLGPVMRTLWSSLLPEKALLQRAFSLDTVAEEVLFMAGPLLATALRPPLGLVLSAGLVVLGAVGMSTSPAARLIGPRSADVTVRLRAPGVRRAALAAAGIGCCLGSLDLYVVVFSERLGHPSFAGWVLAAHSAASAVGGLLFGRLSLRWPAPVRLPFLLAGLAVLLAATGSAPAPAWFALGIVLAGCVVAPSLSTAYLAADELAPPGAATRAGAWVNTGFNAGASAGSALGGVLADRVPLPACFALAALAPLGVAALLVRTRGGTGAGRSGNERRAIAGTPRRSGEPAGTDGHAPH